MTNKIITKNKTKVKKIKNSSIWTQQEHQKMIEFLINEHQELLLHMRAYIDKSTRINKNKFYLRMSAYVGSKSAKQCKSRYQKKEMQILEILNIPSGLIDKYLNHKQTKNLNYLNKNKKKSIDPLRISDSKLNIKEEQDHKIISFEQLKSDLTANIIPKIQNPTIKSYLERFIINLPHIEPLLEDRSVLDLKSLCTIQPQLSFSLRIIRDKNSG